MDFLELAQSRWSVRNYDARPVEQEKLDRILEAARLAPTGANRQPQRLYVLRSEEALARLRAATRMAFNAPLVIVACAKVDEAWHNERETVMRGTTCDTYNVAEMDASIVCDHMQLAATEVGLGTITVRQLETLYGIIIKEEVCQIGVFFFVKSAVYTRKNLIGLSVAFSIYGIKAI